MVNGVRLVHFLNQFFAGIGGEEHANTPIQVQEGAIGPGRALQQILGKRGSIVATIIGGDNYVNEEKERALSEVRQVIRERGPHVVVAGPAFNAGRYGLACGAVCRAAQDMGIPGVTAMHPENPGVLSYRRDVVIVPIGASPAEMQKALSAMLPIVVKLGTGQRLGPPAEEGYIPRGIRKVATRDEPGYKRAVDMLAAKLRGQPFQTEVPYQQPDRVEPAAPIVELGRATIALISTGGLIPKANPDRQTSGNPDRYFTYSVEGLQTLTSDDWEAFHGGYYNQISSENPNYVLPLSFVRRFEADGIVGRVHPTIFTMPGVSTPVDKARRFGSQIAQELGEWEVDGCILVAT